MKANARFITFEGGEGAGKTTLIDKVEKALTGAGIAVIRTREPGGTPFGEEMRQWLLGNGHKMAIGAKAELLLFLAARAQHIDEVIAPAIKAGKIVLCDRFNDSTIAYQGAARGLGIGWVQQLCRTVCGSVLPELTFYLDIPPEVGLERTRRIRKEHAAAGEVDRIEAEKLEFHRTVREAFLELVKAEPGRFCCVDATKTPKEVFEIVTRRLIDSQGNCNV